MPAQLDRILAMAGIGMFMTGSVMGGAEPVAEAKPPAPTVAWIEIDRNAVPGEMASPEGRTRWDFAAIGATASFSAGVAPVAGRAAAFERVEIREDLLHREVWVDPTGGNAAERWLQPQSDPDLAATGGTAPFYLIREEGESTEDLSIRTKRVGVGWLFLPAGPREVVLQRALILVRPAGAATYEPRTVVHRWVDPRQGVLAEIAGPASADGQRRLSVDSATAVAELRNLGPALRIYADELDHAPFTRLNIGWDRGSGVAVSSLDPAAYGTIGALIGASSWDFSGNNAVNSVGEIGSTNVLVNSSETCNWSQCGFTVPGGLLGREDFDFDTPASTNKIFSVSEREDRASDTTIWLRAGVVNEGEAGSLGTGESRFCYTGAGHTPVPLWRFSHQDGAGQPFYMLNGDSWGHTPFACENNYFNHVCPNSCGTLCNIWVKACGGYSGTQASAVVNEGPVTLPSGHTFESLVVRQVTEFCVYLGSSCGIAVDNVRTVLYFWITPHLGTLVRLQSAQQVSDTTSFTTLDKTDFKFGLFPPRSITVTNVDTTTVELSWDPGLDTHRIDGYRIYWDTDSGGSSAYAFDSVNNPGQVSIAGTTAVISGLTPGTEYFFTVTSLYDYTDPSSLVSTLYESPLYPTTIPGTPDPLPMEVSATTTGGTCTPTLEIVKTMLGDRLDPAGTTRFCWEASTDPCTDGYTIVGSNGGCADFHVVVPDTGLTTCHTFNPTETYFIVAAKGSGGVGPWGHCGQ